MSDLRGLAEAAKREIEKRRAQDVLWVHPAPSLPELHVVAAWLFANGVDQEGVRLAIAKAVDGLLKDDRDWLNVLQGFVNKAVREGMPSFRSFQGEWLGMRRMIEEVRYVEEEIAEWEAEQREADA